MRSRQIRSRSTSRTFSILVKTVRRALKQETPPVPPTRNRLSQLDPFKEKIVSLLKEYPTLSAVRIREEIPNCQGGMTILKDYVRAIRPRKREAFRTPG